MFTALFGGFEPPKLKSHLKMSVRRFKLVKNKRSQELKKSRRDVALHLQAGEYEKARVRVEPLIRKDHEIDAFEILELMAELLHERIGVVQHERGVPPELAECIQTLTWAAPRLAQEVPELKVVRQQLAYKYTPAYIKVTEEHAKAVALGRGVPPLPADKPQLADFELSINGKVLAYLGIDPPSPKTLMEYLKALAAEFGLQLEEAKLTSVCEENALGQYSSPAQTRPGGAVPTAMDDSLSSQGAGNGGSDGPASGSGSGAAHSSGVGAPPEHEEGIPQSAASDQMAYGAGYNAGYAAAQAAATRSPEIAAPGYHTTSVQPKGPASPFGPASAVSGAVQDAESDFLSGAARVPGTLPTGGYGAPHDGSGGYGVPQGGSGVPPMPHFGPPSGTGAAPYPAAAGSEPIDSPPPAYPAAAPSDSFVPSKTGAPSAEGTAPPSYQDLAARFAALKK